MPGRAPPRQKAMRFPRGDQAGAPLFRSVQRPLGRSASTTVSPRGRQNARRSPFGDQRGAYPLPSVTAALPLAATKPTTGRMITFVCRVYATKRPSAENDAPVPPETSSGTEAADDERV